VGSPQRSGRKRASSIIVLIGITLLYKNECGTIFLPITG
jgi:hypothetical protein